nr:hypothetical protein [Tanacetum cinerariifolium]
MKRLFKNEDWQHIAQLCKWAWRKGLVAEAYEWEEEDVSSDDNEMTEVKVIIALAGYETISMAKKAP